VCVYLCAFVCVCARARVCLCVGGGGLSRRSAISFNSYAMCVLVQHTHNLQLEQGRAGTRKGLRGGACVAAPG
jgi:hypothetical protein